MWAKNKKNQNTWLDWHRTCKQLTHTDSFASYEAFDKVPDLKSNAVFSFVGVSRELDGTQCPHWSPHNWGGAHESEQREVTERGRRADCNSGNCKRQGRPLRVNINIHAYTVFPGEEMNERIKSAISLKCVADTHAVLRIFIAVMRNSDTQMRKKIVERKRKKYIGRNVSRCIAVTHMQTRSPWPQFLLNFFYFPSFLWPMKSFCRWSR